MSLLLILVCIVAIVCLGFVLLMYLVMSAAEGGALGMIFVGLMLAILIPYINHLTS